MRQGDLQVEVPIGRRDEVVGEVLVAVSDQGVGIPVAEQSHVFEKFFRVQRTDLRVGGTGLGLALSHEIVVAHGMDSRAWRARARGSGSRSRPPDRRIRRRLRRIRFNSVPEHAFWVLPSDPRPSVLAMSNQEPSKARDTALAGALSQIEKQFGKGSVMRMGDPGAQVKVEAIPTGALSLDLALGIGGVPRGRIVEVFGPESSGKTTLIYHLIAEAQKLGGVCAFIDAEHAMDPLYAQKIGVNIDELLVSQPDYGEQALEIADMLVRSGAVDVVAVDSVAALTPRAELEGQMGDQSVGLQARMMSQAMRKLAGNLNRTKTLCVFTNQIREKVGVMFGSPETQPGGRALKFYASQRLDIRRIETLKDGTEAVGNRVRVKVVKNKVAAPFRQAEFDIEFGTGISSSGCILDLGIEHSIVTKSGSFFSYGDERLGQGRNNAKAYLDEHQEVAKEIEAKIYDVLGVNQDLVEPIENDADPGEIAALVG